MSEFLAKILAEKEREVQRLRFVSDVADLRARALSHAPRGFANSLASEPVSVIAEIKRRSPSKGALAEGLDPASLARSYHAAGATALSVLTDESFFGALPDDLPQARAACPLPVLRKDFVIDPLQLHQARAMGADAVLLIVMALGGAKLRSLYEHARELSLDVLVECHDEAELERALDCEDAVIGVNSRNLTTFTVDLSIAERLGSQIPAERITVAESGIRGADDAARMFAAGYNAVLVGESLVRSEDIQQQMTEIRQQVSS